MSIGREVVVLQYPKVVQAWDIPCRFLRILSVTDETGHKGQPQFSQYITIHQKRSDHEHHHRMNQEWSGSNSCFHFTLKSQDDIDAMVRDKTTTFASRLEYIYICITRTCPNVVFSKQSHRLRNLGTETTSCVYDRRDVSAP
jgi:hypothetical protein